jgi:hypothetical protein
MRKQRLVLPVLFVSLFISPVFAHHGTAVYDMQHETTVEGVVKDFEWSSPHSWIYINVTGANGEVAEWGGETGAPGTLARRGWTSHMFKPGDKVKMTGHAAKDGSKVLMLTKVETADGKVF